MRTTVGISSKASRREAQIWPAAWKASRVMGRIWIHWIGARGSSGLGLMMPIWTTVAAMRRAAVWRLKERTSVDRRRGVRARER